MVVLDRFLIELRHRSSETLSERHVAAELSRLPNEAAAFFLSDLSDLSDLFEGECEAVCRIIFPREMRGGGRTVEER